PAKKAPVAKSAPKAPAKKAVAVTSKTSPKPAAAKPTTKTGAPKGAPAEVRRQLTAPRKRAHTPVIFKTRVRRNTPVVFSLDDLHKHLEERKKTGSHSTVVRPEAPAKKTAASKAVPAKVVRPVVDFPEPERRNHGAASVSDILGFNPAQKRRKYEWGDFDEDRVPKKFIKHFKALLNLREHVIHGLQTHTEQTLKRSSKEDSGDLSSYGQHMADAATDAFDRDFALSLLSNEQDALYEIDEAIQRIYDGSYGQCEITGEGINQDRLDAVPFTRYSLKGQQEYERTHRRAGVRGNILFADVTADEVSAYGEDDSDDS
ncbi:MAG TPA: transcriptional regulator, partial [Opitutales bacterium]|nr:transcriptional regulator [Opitutales bacterium]